jgi:hypothetical protein
MVRRTALAESFKTLCRERACNDVKHGAAPTRQLRSSFSVGPVDDCNLIAFRRVFQKLCRERQPASPVRIFAPSRLRGAKQVSLGGMVPSRNSPFGLTSRARGRSPDLFCSVGDVNRVTSIGRVPAYMIPSAAVASPFITKRPNISSVKPCASMIASVQPIDAALTLDELT